MTTNLNIQYQAAKCGLEYRSNVSKLTDIFTGKALKPRRPRIFKPKTNRPAKVISPRPKTNDEKWAELCEITRRMERNGVNKVRVS